MKKKMTIAGLCLLLAAIQPVILMVSCSRPFGWIDRTFGIEVSSGGGSGGAPFVAVTGITGLPTQAYAKLGSNMYGLTLGGTVAPATATNQTITWTVKDADGTGASISGSTFTAVDDGTVTVTAAIADGLAVGIPYTQDFDIDVQADYVPGVGIIERAFIPHGDFTMAAGSVNSSYPPHLVTLTKDFYMGKYEVTQAQFQAVLGITQSQLITEVAGGFGSPAGVGGDYPVYYVRWYAAIAFCNKLSLMAGLEPVYTVTGVNWATLTYANIPNTKHTAWDNVVMDRGKNGYRLPTEAEWEYAARAETTTTYINGNAAGDGFGIGAYAWYSANSGGSTHPVGELRPNARGLYDIFGNASEYVWDWATSFGTAPQTDPVGNELPPAGTSLGMVRTLRGSSFYSNEMYLSFTGSVGAPDPYTQYKGAGFRVVRKVN